VAATTEGGGRGSGAQLFTKDQLAARTPRNGPHALSGPDRDYWLPGIKKDFAIIRDNKCIINITSVRPHGPAPPTVEQRFKIKHFSEEPIALADIDPSNWKAAPWPVEIVSSMACTMTPLRPLLCTPLPSK
jgi:hypothetical protein